MTENVLEKIIQNKKKKIINLKRNISLDSLNDLIDQNKTFINFKLKIENNIKNSKFSIIEKAGHLINIENPKAFNYKTLQFLKELNQYYKQVQFEIIKF